jgi:hypothetical protein
MSKAFNSPKALSEDIRAHRDRKRFANTSSQDGSDVIALFRSSGIPVIDTTPH